MIITLCFLSGEIMELDVPKDVSLVRNVKAMISEELYIKDGIDCDIDLIHLYTYNMNNDIEMPDNQHVFEGEMYRVMICTLHRYVIYLENDTVYYKEIGQQNEEAFELSDYELHHVTEKNDVQYFFDLKSFQKSWLEGDSFFGRFGFELRDDEYDNARRGLYLSEDEGEDDEYNEYDIKFRTLDCLRKIFRRVQYISDVESI